MNQPSRATNLIKAFTTLLPATIQLPFVWIKSLSNSRLLFQAKWSNYLGFDLNSSFNNLFYRTQWVNLNKYGTKGLSKEIGLGDYPLNKWFHLSVLSSYIFANSAATTMLFGTLLTFLSFIIFASVYNPFWVISITIAAILSSSVFAMAFYRQNYQILGWMLVPSAYFELHRGDMLPATIILFICAMFAMTPLILSSIPLISGIGMFFDFNAVFTLVPALILVFTYSFRPWSKNHSWDSIKQLGKLIGALDKKNVKYVRKSMKIDIFLIYFCTVNLVAFFLLKFIYGANFYPIIFVIIIGIVNERFIRIADFESVIMIQLIITLFIVVTQPPNLMTFLVIWLVFNYPLKSLGIKTNNKNGKNLRLKIMRPLDLSKTFTSVNALFQKMDSSRKVLMVFPNPDNTYEKLFNGFRSFAELPIYISNLNSMHIIPDWYLISETNYPGAKEFWCDNHVQLEKNFIELGRPYMLFFKWKKEEVNWNTRFKISSLGVNFLGKIDLANTLELNFELDEVDVPEIEIWG